MVPVPQLAREPRQECLRAAVHGGEESAWLGVWGAGRRAGGWGRGRGVRADCSVRSAPLWPGSASSWPGAAASGAGLMVEQALCLFTAKGLGLRRFCLEF